MSSLGRYRIERILGEGGVGQVLLVSDRLRGAQRVALKRLGTRADELLRSTFEREFSALASLSLPGVARVFDFGVVAPGEEGSGSPFFTRAYVPGQALGDAMKEASAKTILRTFLEVCRIVAAVHRQGVVHGDLKPANVIVDGSGKPWLIDFGLAAIPSTAAAEGVAGTPAFMAPELFQGGTATVAADVYALSLTLWRLLVGRVPFEELGAGALEARVSGRRPMVPDDAGPIESQLCRAVLPGLAADPAERLPTVNELLAALESLGLDRRIEPGSFTFVPPHPRGHREVLARIDDTASRALQATGPSREVLVLRGARGSGKSVLLRELKWRLQLRGVCVVEIAGRPESALGPLEAIALHAATEGCAGADGLAVQLREGAVRGDESIENQVAGVLGALAARRPTAVLVDDLDRVEPLLARCLRLALHGERQSALAVIATSTGADNGVAEVGHYREEVIPPLAFEPVASLVTDALGVVDASVAKAVYERSAGNPGQILDLLAAVARPGTHVPTAADVRAARATAGEAAARLQLVGASDAVRQLLALLASVRAPLTRKALEADSHVSDAVVGEALATGLVEASGDTFAIADAALSDLMRAELSAEQIRGHASRLLSSGVALTSLTRARLSQAAGDAEALREHVPVAADELITAGALTLAVDLLQSLQEHQLGAAARQTQLRIAQLELTLSHFDSSATRARSLIEDSQCTADERVEASLVAVKAFAKMGSLARAIEVLDEVSRGVPDRHRVAICRERARLELARSDQAAADAAAREGLAHAERDDASRTDLLAVAAMVATYREDHDEARRLCREGIALARQRGAAKDEAHCQVYLAIDHHRAGQFVDAKRLYEEALDTARQADDVAALAFYTLNLGTVCDDLGEHTIAATHYVAASRLARRAGVVSGDVAARCNLAHVNAYLGLYERAYAEASSARDDALRFGFEASVAQATVLLGEIGARQGDVEESLLRYDDALARYRKLDQSMEIAEVLIDIAEVLFDRGGAADGSAAVARLGEARTLVKTEKLDALTPSLNWLLSRARAHTGDLDGAVADLEHLLGASPSVSTDIRWKVLATLAQLNMRRGADFLARRQHAEAMEILESIATKLPRESREAFWRDPRRRGVRRWAHVTTSPAGARAPSPESLSETTSSLVNGPLGLEARTARLLELIKRLASEHDLDRLLDRINDSAVELAGAERGFVLLVDEAGQLEPRSVREMGMRDKDPHVTFSQSIAEAVLIDGEPIVTVDARDDRRVSEYLSVHKLMLKSVACLPIRGRTGTVGVLYLEHRMRRGRFAEADIDLLFAFADQAAIALENTRLIEENQRRREELEEANAELEAAKAEIERVLAARTVELEDAKREVVAARRELRDRYSQHGLIGTSEAMRRVFTLVDRVSETSVSVVIHGESGTGKELVARAIHHTGSRAQGPFVAVNCAAIPEALLESALFGHVRGAFTGADRDRRGFIAQASGGTLFLDEVSDMPSKMQVDLLRVLQDGKVRAVGGDVDEDVDIRIVSASNRRLSDEVKRGSFREDLFYRLHVVEINMPPLRDRDGDLRLLADHFLRGFAARDRARPKRLSSAALQRLEASEMPGNVRQLEHVLLNAWVLVDGDVIEVDDLSLTGAVTERPAPVSKSVSPPPTSETDSVAVPQTVRDHKDSEKQRILAALEAHGWNRVQAAKALSMPRRTFYRRLKEYDVL